MFVYFLSGNAKSQERLLVTWTKLRRRTRGKRYSRSHNSLKLVDVSSQEDDPVSVTQLSDAVELSPSSVHKHLQILRGHGFVTKKVRSTNLDLCSSVQRGRHANCILEIQILNRNCEAFH